MTVECRFCGSGVHVSLPPGEFASRMAKMIVNRGCCERCKAYHSERVARIDYIAKQCIDFGRAKPGEAKETLRSAIATAVGKIVGAAAVHHSKPLGQYAGELLEAIYADPFNSRELCEMFEKGCK